MELRRLGIAIAAALLLWLPASSEAACSDHNGKGCGACADHCHTCSSSAVCTHAHAGYYLVNQAPILCDVLTIADCAAHATLKLPKTNTFLNCLDAQPVHDSAVAGQITILVTVSASRICLKDLFYPNICRCPAQ